MRVTLFTYWNNVWVRYLKKYFDTIKDIDFRVEVNSQLNSNIMQESDITIFGWADKSVIEASKYFMKFSKKYIVFCRSYEIFFGHIRKINWKHIDSCIFVNKHFSEEFGSKIPTKVEYLPNAIDLDEWKFQKHEAGYDIAWVANLSHKKGIDLIPQFMHKLCQKDKRYKLHLAGADQEPRHIMYLKYQLEELGLTDNVIFYNSVKGIQDWLKDKSYLFTCSVTEGHPNNVLEAMSLGIKPIIHTWLGAKEQFPKHLLWSDIDTAVKLVTEDEYNSESYRKFIINNYDLWKVYPRLEDIIRNV